MLILTKKEKSKYSLGLESGKLQTTTSTESPRVIIDLDKGFQIEEILNDSEHVLYVGPQTSFKIKIEFEIMWFNLKNKEEFFEVGTLAQ